MTASKVIGFGINIFVFLLFNYFLGLYLSSHKRLGVKYCAIIIISICLSMVNLLRNPALNVISTFALLLAFSFLFFIDKPIKKIVFSIVSVAMTSLAELLLTFTITLFSFSTLQEILSDELIYLLTGFSGCMILWGLITIIHKQYPLVKGGEYGYDMLVLALFPTIAVVNMLVILYYDNQLQPVRWIHFITVLALLIFLFLSVVVFFLYNASLQNKELEHKIQMDKEMHTWNKLLFKQQQKEMEALQRLKHEYKGHLQCLYDFSHDGMLAEVQTYCQKELGNIQLDEQTLPLLDFNNFTIGNIYARFINECKRRSIKYTADITFRNFLFINDIDASVLFNNLFNNALEACDGSGDNKWIALQIYRVRRNVVIKLTNSIGHPIRKNGEQFLSSKRDYKKAGVGISQMMAIAEQYGGYTVCSFSSEHFEVIIYLVFTQNDL